MPIIAKRTAAENLRDTERPLTDIEFRRYKDSFGQRVIDHHKPAMGVDTSFDLATVYFKTETFTELLKAEFDYFVFFLVCEGMAKNYQKLSVLVAGVNKPTTTVTTFYEAHDTADGTGIDKEVETPIIKVGNYQKRCEAVSTFRHEFNPLNEFKGYAHERNGLIKKAILDKGAKTVIVHFGVSPQNRLTVMLIGGDDNYVPLISIQADDQVLDNGTMCCPIP